MEYKMYYVAYGILRHKWKDRIRLLLCKRNNWNLHFWIFILEVIRIDYSRNEGEVSFDAIRYRLIFYVRWKAFLTRYIATRFSIRVLIKLRPNAADKKCMLNRGINCGGGNLVSSSTRQVYPLKNCFFVRKWKIKNAALFLLVSYQLCVIGYHAFDITRDKNFHSVLSQNSAQTVCRTIVRMYADVLLDSNTTLNIHERR